MGFNSGFKGLICYRPDMRTHAGQLIAGTKHYALYIFGVDVKC